MPTVMVSVNSNISEYNGHFDAYYTQLLHRGCNYDAPFQALFDSYLVVKDSDFRDYMKRIYDNWLDERKDMVDLTYEKLMTMALAKYNF